MHWKGSKYLFVYLTPVIVAFSLGSQGWWTFTAVAVLFGLLPLMELFTVGSTHNLTELEEEMAKKDSFYDWLLYGLVPAQYALLVYFLYRVTYTPLTTLEQVGLTLSFGMSCGILGINAAHELGHRVTWHEQWMSKALLLTSLYMHFFIEHNKGHHKHVSTDEDPASARYGESVYAFYFRSIYGSWLSAWRLEAKRLGKFNRPAFSWPNEMLRFQVIQLLFVGAIGLAFGSKTMLLFIAAATIGFLLLESVNYIEHYGLQRRKVNGKYERVLPIHSWNSNHPLGRLVLLELSRHSDHHYLASRKYQILRHFDESPQMPTGYPGMILLALVPPLWFAVMHRQIDQFRKGGEGLVSG
ncbi:alkane 1-monooxygenase [Flavihumibacter rivuli]|uniref:alkane 1-monooxygenase n=1 Tax=Flavihumibacter rivuli TaxID=2838156 RepID=UPI001BDE2709|nr:alkane 1-monooxygenase [Flavihumibacter rivuli]ULQ55234.1 alkane 1-monooxygenase [Flavihumibacter rivuli]